MSSSENSAVPVKRGNGRQQLSASKTVYTEFVQLSKQDLLSPGLPKRFSKVKVYDLKGEESDEESETTESLHFRGFAVTESSDRSSSCFRHVRRENFLHPVEVERLVPSFNGKEGSCARWIRKIEGYAVVYGWSPRACLHYGQSRLTGTARKWFEAQDEVTLNWECFKTSLCEAFPSRKNEADVHFKLASRFRGEDEDEESYVYEMQRIAKEGRISEEAVIAYIVSNIEDEMIQEYLISKDLHQVKELIRCLQRYLRMRAVVNTEPCVEAVQLQAARNESTVVEEAAKQPSATIVFKKSCQDFDLGSPSSDSI